MQQELEHRFNRQSLAMLSLRRRIEQRLAEEAVRLALAIQVKSTAYTRRRDQQFIDDGLHRFGQIDLPESYLHSSSSVKN
jgi:hypothetical protein